MNLEQLITAIINFRQQVQEYRDLMVRSRDRVVPEIRRNGEEIRQMRASLTGELGRLERYIRTIGNNPRMTDGVHQQAYSVYHNAFSADILLRVGPSTDAVLQDLDYIAGRLNGMTEDEFNEIMNPEPREREENLRPTNGITAGGNIQAGGNITVGNGNEMNGSERSGLFFKIVVGVLIAVLAGVILHFIGIAQ